MLVEIKNSYYQKTRSKRVNSLSLRARRKGKQSLKTVTSSAGSTSSLLRDSEDQRHLYF
ncbi:hypothetical protein DPMN_177204 [Dreissena polymorpha]|uniref:Uncharacterized protein n=1 Tax=Dreissena polymorpha TaxID=45954 RepID=A0A9D4EBQ3_DREPO|nr:hypothetical protein DPMN_177204 [Dreissena polymorpha]